MISKSRVFLTLSIVYRSLYEGLPKLIFPISISKVILIYLEPSRGVGQSIWISREMTKMARMLCSKVPRNIRYDIN